MLKNKSEIYEKKEDISKFVNLLYQQKISEAMEEFKTVSIAIQDIVDSFFYYKQDNNEFDLDEEKMSTIFKEIVTAVEDQDYILLADIIQYDFLEYINELCESLD